QRRRRVFLVGHLGDRRRATAVLFERHSLQGNLAPRREARQGAADQPQGGARGGVYRKATRPHAADDAERWETDELAGTLNGWEERRVPPPHLVAGDVPDLAHARNAHRS